MNNNNKKACGNNINKPENRLSFLSHLAHRWADVIEMVQVAEPLALKNIDLSALAWMAYAEQKGDDHLLSSTLIRFASYIQNSLHVNYCEKSVNKLIQETQHITPRCQRSGFARIGMFNSKASFIEQNREINFRDIDRGENLHYAGIN